MTKTYWISCKCRVCEEEIELEGSYEDARKRQRDFEDEHYHSGHYRVSVCRAEKDTPPTDVKEEDGAL